MDSASFLGKGIRGEERWDWEHDQYFGGIEVPGFCPVKSKRCD